MPSTKKRENETASLTDQLAQLQAHALRTYDEHAKRAKSTLTASGKAKVGDVMAKQQSGGEALVRIQASLKDFKGVVRSVQQREKDDITALATAYTEKSRSATSAALQKLSKLSAAFGHSAVGDEEASDIE